MQNLISQLKRSIYEDGEVSEAEVSLLSDFIDHHGANDQTIEILLDLNNIMSGIKFPVSFIALFNEQITAYAIDSTGDVTAEKWDWLKRNLLKDGIIDDVEKSLLSELIRRARQVPAEMLQFAEEHR